MRGEAWNEYDATDLGQEVASTVTDMIAGRDARITELERQLEGCSRDLALAEARINFLDRVARAERV